LTEAEVNTMQTSEHGTSPKPNTSASVKEEEEEKDDDGKKVLLLLKKNMHICMF